VADAEVVQPLLAEPDMADVAVAAEEREAVSVR
jgi:hypothetical protein